MHVHTKDVGETLRISSRWLGSHTRSRLAMIGGVAGAASVAAVLASAGPASAACSPTTACIAGMNFDATGAPGNNVSWASMVLGWQYWGIPNWTTEKSVMAVWAHWNTTNTPWVAVGAWRGYLAGLGSTNTTTWYKGQKDSSGTVTYANVSGAGTLGTGPAAGDQTNLAIGDNLGTGCWTPTINSTNPTTHVSTSAVLGQMCGYATTTQHLFAGIETKVTPSPSFKLKGYGSGAHDLGSTGGNWGAGGPYSSAYVTPGSGYCAIGTPSSFDFSADTIPC